VPGERLSARAAQVPLPRAAQMPRGRRRRIRRRTRCAPSLPPARPALPLPAPPRLKHFLQCLRFLLPPPAARTPDAPHRPRLLRKGRSTPAEAGARQLPAGAGARAPPEWAHGRWLGWGRFGRREGRRAGRERERRRLRRWARRSPKAEARPRRTTGPARRLESESASALAARLEAQLQGRAKWRGGGQHRRRARRDICAGRQ
jgi:hypothetical protein